jgi:metallo-beta-lactamase family protein
LKIQFLGAAQQVTGSSYYVEMQSLRLLVDCGLYQERAYLGRNWSEFSMSPRALDWVLLTHVHLDHSGLLPKLVREGFPGQILTTPASADLLPIVLLDSARIHEEDAAFKKKRHQKEGRTGPYPELPLYTEADAARVTPHIEPVEYEKDFPLNSQVTARFHDAGHVLGSAMIEFTIRGKKDPLRLIFSGDIGRPNRPLIRDPFVFEQADDVVMESTYGDRNHEDPADTETMLSDIITETARAGGHTVIPVFAIERAQELLFYLSRLLRRRRIPRLPVFLDSPMAMDVTEVFLRHPECLDKETLAMLRSGRSPFKFPGLRLVRTQEESKKINSQRSPVVIMAGSGMCTGGRIKHHLMHNIGRPESTLLFVGYQAEGTLGREILQGRPEVRIFGQFHRVRMKIRQMHSFSAHAGRDDLIGWLDHLRRPLPRLFLTHGEKDVISSLAEFLRDNRGFEVNIPTYEGLWEAKL